METHQPVHGEMNGKKCRVGRLFGDTRWITVFRVSKAYVDDTRVLRTAHKDYDVPAVRANSTENAIIIF